MATKGDWHPLNYCPGHLVEVFAGTTNRPNRPSCHSNRHLYLQHIGSMPSTSPHLLQQLVVSQTPVSILFGVGGGDDLCAYVCVGLRTVQWYGLS